MALEIRNIRLVGTHRACLYLVAPGKWIISRTRDGLEMIRCGVWTEPSPISETVARRLIRYSKRRWPSEHRQNK